MLKQGLKNCESYEMYNNLFLVLRRKEKIDKINNFRDGFYRINI